MVSNANVLTYVTVRPKTRGWFEYADSHNTSLLEFECWTESNKLHMLCLQSLQPLLSQQVALQ